MARLVGALYRCADPESRDMATMKLVLRTWECMGAPRGGLEAYLLMRPINPALLSTVEVPGSREEPAIQHLQVAFVASSESHRVGVPGPNIPIAYKPVAVGDMPATELDGLVLDEVHPCDLLSFKVR